MRDAVSGSDLPGAAAPRERPVHWVPLPYGMRPWFWRFANGLWGLVFSPRRFRVLGRDRLPARGGVLLVVNHLHDVDPSLVSVACMPRVANQLAAARHFERRWLAWIMTGLAAFPVRTDRPDTRALRHARELLGAGRLVVIYPEGAPSYSDRLGTFHEGVGFLALTPGITVIPAAIWGTHRAMRAGLPIGRHPVTLAYGRPFPVPLEGSRRERTALVTEQLKVAVRGLLAELTAGEARP